MDFIKTRSSIEANASTVLPGPARQHAVSAAYAICWLFGRHRNQGVVPEKGQGLSRKMDRILSAVPGSSRFAAVLACLTSSVHQRARADCRSGEVRSSIRMPCLLILKLAVGKAEAGNKGRGRTKPSLRIAQGFDDRRWPRKEFVVEFPSGNPGRVSRQNPASTSALPV